MSAANLDELSAEDSRRRSDQHRLAILDALLIALEHRDDLFRVVESAVDADEARRDVMAAFALSEIQATAALELQVSRFARHEIQRVAGEREQLRVQLGLN